MSITSTQIIKTRKASDEELQGVQKKSRREIDDFNRDSSSVVLISIGRGYDSEDIEEAGEDVTAHFISYPPGYNLTSQILNHPWVVALASGVIVAGIVAWLGWA